MIFSNLTIEVKVLLSVCIKEGEYAMIEYPTIGENHLRAIYDLRRCVVVGNPIYNHRLDTELFIKWIRENLDNEKENKYTKEDRHK